MRQATALKTFRHDGELYRRGQRVTSSAVKISSLVRNGLAEAVEEEDQDPDLDQAVTLDEITAEDIAGAVLDVGAENDRDVRITFPTPEAATAFRREFGQAIESAGKALEAADNRPAEERQTKPAEKRETKPRQEPRRQANRGKAANGPEKGVVMRDRRERTPRRLAGESTPAADTPVDEAPEQSEEEKAEAARRAALSDEERDAEDQKAEDDRRAALTDEEREEEDRETARRDALTPEERAAEDGAAAPAETGRPRRGQRAET